MITSKMELRYCEAASNLLLACGRVLKNMTRDIARVRTEKKYTRVVPRVMESMLLMKSCDLA